MISLSRALSVATDAALRAGELLVARQNEEMHVDELHQNDIKLQADRESQDLIARAILSAFPDHGVLGEEGCAGDPESSAQWIVDPIDGTVNYYYGIPHFGISIALRVHEQVVLGVIHDPMVREFWTVMDDGTPTLNQRAIRVSDRTALSDAIVSVGFAKRPEALAESVRRYGRVAPAVRKLRMLGSAALEMAYVASGRLDAYVEEQVSIWDIAAGRLLVERAGGRVALTPHPNRPDRFSIICTNGRVPIEALLAEG
ncbi:MAG: inositol monophosphatase [Spirochaetaceae bacterium]|nr:MAG: inositol monophosphatase [Spirochaetaceae bacterium]